MAEPEFIQSKPEGGETNPSCFPDPGTTLSKGEPVRSDRPSSGTNRASSSSSRSSDRPSSGTSRLSDRTGSGASKASHCAHSRTSSSSSGDGLLLSVSALARAGGRGAGQDTEGGTRHAPEPDKVEPGGSEQSYNSLDSEHSCTCSGGEGMGQREGRPTPPVAEREEPEGLEEGSNNFSLLAIDKRVFGRLQDELTAAQSELKLKEEEVTRLSRIRDDVEDELTELTASLFQEAHRMVREANVKAFQSEKALVESNMKVDGLQTEVAALKALVITSTPSKPNRHLHPQLDRKRSSDRRSGSSAPGSPAKERMVEGAEEVDIKEKYIDPVLRAEYLQWKKLPNLEPGNPFLSRVFTEDIDPCLEFTNKELGARVKEAVIQNTLCLDPVKDDEELPRNCSLFEQPRRCSHRLTFGDADTQSHYISHLARNRIAAVCDFLTYCRYVTQGLVKAHCNEVYWEIMLRRRNMAIARLGFLN